MFPIVFKFQLPFIVNKFQSLNDSCLTNNCKLSCRKENNYWLSQLILVTTLIQEQPSQMEQNPKFCFNPFQVFQVIHFGDCELTISNIGLHKKKTSWESICLWYLTSAYFGFLSSFWDSNILWRSLVRNDKYFILCLEQSNN